MDCIVTESQRVGVAEQLTLPYSLLNLARAAKSHLHRSTTDALSPTPHAEPPGMFDPHPHQAPPRPSPASMRPHPQLSSIPDAKPHPDGSSIPATTKPHPFP